MAAVQGFNVRKRTLSDIRDNETYVIRKLADGNCWMSQNLRLMLSTSRALSPDDTDIHASWVPDLSTQTSVGVSWGTNTNATDINKSRSFIDISYKEYGGYYNWYAATAGTGSYSTVSGDATGSICPNKWGLPKNTTQVTLYKTYSIANDYYGYEKTLLFPLNFTMSGGYSPNSYEMRLSYASYWSSTASSDIRAYDMESDNSLVISVIPQDTNPKVNGYSIRCVAH